jgi:mannose-6-phosphate isomerase-like protein (cupin superfamily)
MDRKTVIALAAIAVTASAAAAQTSPHLTPPEQFKFLSAKDVAALTSKPGPWPKTAYLGDHEDYYVEYAERSDTGNQAEVHAHWTHYINVLAGEATLTYGGAISHPRQTGPGQIRGDAIMGGKSMTVHAGDYLQIPAGTPHMFRPAPGTMFRYVVFNARQ